MVLVDAFAWPPRTGWRGAEVEETVLEIINCEMTSSDLGDFMTDILSNECCTTIPISKEIRKSSCLLEVRREGEGRWSMLLHMTGLQG